LSSNKSNQSAKAFFTGFTGIIIPVIIAVAICIYIFVLGSPANFEGGDTHNHPLPGNFLGIVYKGGIIVPIILSLLMMVITFFIERYITLRKATGHGSVSLFVKNIHGLVARKEFDQAIVLCDKQRGSVANVIKTGILKFRELIDVKEMNRDQKVVAIQKEIEEATSLELPMLEQNLVIISTIASIGTLFGLLGTVVGMIKAFSALAQAGAADSVALSNGISEALINTALGISTSALAIISYNYFTTKIDGLTYSIDEAGYSIVQNFVAQHK
jgi:biopolymer transport protein ExbB